MITFNGACVYIDTLTNNMLMYMYIVQQYMCRGSLAEAYYVHV